MEQNKNDLSNIVFILGILPPQLLHAEANLIAFPWSYLPETIDKFLLATVILIRFDILKKNNNNNNKKKPSHKNKIKGVAHKGVPFLSSKYIFHNVWERTSIKHHVK